MPKIISLHDVLEPLKQALLASRDVKNSSQICSSNLQKVFTLGDGCWLPITALRDPSLKVPHGVLLNLGNFGHLPRSAPKSVF